MVPRFLSTGFKYVEINSGVSDVQQIIDAAVALVTAPTDPSSGWTAFTSSGGFYFSPTTSLRVPQFKFSMTRATQYRMQLTMKGQNDVTLGNRFIQIPSTNLSTARIFAGDGHFCIDVNTWSTTPEFLWCGSLDVTPDVIDFPGINTGWMGGTRRSDYAREYYTCGNIIMQWGDDAPTTSPNEYVGQYRQTGGTAGPKRHLSGALIYRPRECWARVRGDTGTYGVEHWIGRCWQILMVPDLLIMPGCKFYAPIDTGVLGQFCVLAGPDTYNNMRSAIRVG